jgi:hypothetical protein
VSRPHWTRRLPRPLSIPGVMRLVTLADVRELLGHLPQDHREKSTWRHVREQLDQVARGGELADVVVPLKPVLAMEGRRMPPAIAAGAPISVRCMSCRHRSTIGAATLARFGLKSDAPIASFVKRLRCSKCGSGNVMAQRITASELYRLGKLPNPSRRRA